MNYYYVVQGYSERRGAFITLFAPYNSPSDACRMRDELRKRNPQIIYRVIARKAEQR